MNFYVSIFEMSKRKRSSEQEFQNKEDCWQSNRFKYLTQRKCDQSYHIEGRPCFDMDKLVIAQIPDQEDRFEYRLLLYTIATWDDDLHDSRPITVEEGDTLRETFNRYMFSYEKYDASKLQQYFLKRRSRKDCKDNLIDLPVTRFYNEWPLIFDLNDDNDSPQIIKDKIDSVKECINGREFFKSKCLSECGFTQDVKHENFVWKILILHVHLRKHLKNIKDVFGQR